MNEEVGLEMAADKQFLKAWKRVKPYQSAEQIPLSFCYGDRAYHGLDEELFHSTVTRRKIDSNIVSRVIVGRLKDGLEVRVECTEYQDFPAVEWYAEFKNCSDKNSGVLTNVKMIDEVYEGTKPVLLHSNGDTVTYEGYEMYRTPVTEEGIHLLTSRGNPCHDVFPFMRLMFEDGGINFAVGWPGGWAGAFHETEGGASVWFGQEVLETYLKPDEIIRTPRVLVMAYHGDEVCGRHQWRDFYRKHILLKENGEPLGPLNVMSYGGGGVEFTKATEQNQLEALEYFLSKGFKPDIWWIDAGWYPCNLKWEAAGTWIPNPDHFPNGFKAIGKKCEENDIRFLLWFELERVTEGSALDVEHAEWMLYRDHEGGKDWTRMLNLAIPECMNWVIERVDAIIKEGHVKIYRQDFNIHPPMIYWRSGDEEGRAGTTENHHIQNLLTFWDTLVDRNPGLWIDNCSSGGRRNDYELMRRSVPIHYTDVGYGVHTEKQQQYRVMFEWIPYFRALGFNWDKPDGTYGEWAMPDDPVNTDKFTTYASFTPAIDQKVKPDYSDGEFETAQFMLEIWKPAAELMLKGNYYPLKESHKDSREYYACQFDEPVSGEGFIEVIRNILVEEESLTIYPYVEEGAVYDFTCMDPKSTMTLTAEELKRGFTVSIPKRSGIVWFYRKK